MITENFLKGRRRRELTDFEAGQLEASVDAVRDLPARATIVTAGEVVRESTLLLAGTMCRYMDARDGQRQLVALHVPGDFVDLHGFPLQRLDHDVATISACRVATMPHERLTEVTERWPHLARLLWFSTLLDAAMHREWIFRIGRLNALARIAHILCETHARLQAIGQTDGGTFEFPLTQQDLGETCGLTSVHVNRMLARLRADGMVRLANRTATIDDLPALRRLGEFDDAYLYLEDSLRTP